ncbi:MAG TPA: hypothetical protein VKB46_10745 [Pyrinomonadaceae bacterium]|nr:hypothetical protein [Pyrinomonadaceae bacterium]
MTKQKSSKRASSSSRRRPALKSVIFVAVVLAIAGVTVIARQVSKTNVARSVAPALVTSTKSPTAVTPKYVTVKVAGRDVQVDSQTGQIRQLTPEEAKQLADGLKGMLNKSTDGLVQEQHPDGTVSMDLQGRFQNVTVAKINPDGTVTQSCVDSPEAAASFFGIDPKLVGANPSTPIKQATTPVRKQNQ